LKYAYEKEIVLYAHHKSLDYFSTECIYSPEAFRGSARALIKNLERVRPSAILDVVRSGEDMARLVPGADASACAGACGSNTKDNAPPQAVADDDEGGCGSAQGAGANDAMARMEAQLAQNERAAEQGLEVEITSPPSSTATPATATTPTTTTKGTKTPLQITQTTPRTAENGHVRPLRLSLQPSSLQSVRAARRAEQESAAERD
jgi:cytoplasmic tRNA 2-thiolation protein 1